MTQKYNLQSNLNLSNKKVYLIDEITINYPILNTKTGNMEPSLLIKGVNIGAEAFDALAEEYHKESLSDRYWEENLDPLSEKKKGQYAREEDGVTQNPIDELHRHSDDVFSMLFGEEDEESPLVIILREKVFPQLTEAQRNLIYAYYGERKTLEEIRTEEIAKTGISITHQAMSNRLGKIHKRVKNLVTEYLPTE